jgi:hypothetical protein
MQDSPNTGRLFNRPTSVLVTGTDRTLLKWVAYALVLQNRGPFFWTDVRMHDEELPGLDPLAEHRVPVDQLSVIYPDELRRNDESARMVDSAVGGVIRADDSPEALRRIAGFLRLPTHTQEMLARMPAGGPPPVAVLSNAHRIVALYPAGTVGPTIRAIVDYGVALILTFADAVGPQSQVFDTILDVRGHDPAHWQDAILRVGKAPATGPFHSGSESPWSKVPWLAEVMNTRAPF